MKVLFSTQSTVQYDGENYYSNPIQAEYKRYLVLGDDITVFCHVKNVEKATHDKINKNIVKFVFAEKINSLQAIIKHYSKENDETAKNEVLKADVCAVSLPSDHGNQVIKYAKKYGKPYITTICGCPWDTYWYYDWRGKLIAPFEFFALRKSQKNAPFSIYVSQRFLQQRYPTKGESIGCTNASIRTGIVEVLENRLETIKSVQLSPSHLRIGTVAAIDVPYKGQQYVIKALSILRKKGIYFEYHLLGRGDSSRLEEIAKKEGVSDIVFFHGTIPHEKVLEFFDALDIYVQPSKTEGLPRALVEAMSRGCLCMGSKAGGIPELLDPDYIFNKGSVKGIVDVLKNITYFRLREQAIRNFEEAKNYNSDFLEERRRKFIERFKESIECQVNNKQSQNRIEK